MDGKHGSLPIAGPEAGETAIDPVCGMTVVKSSAKHTLDHDGVRYYFCSRSCRDKFAANPSTFRAHSRSSSIPAPPLLKRQPLARPSHDAIYVCPMHPEVRQRGPGSCPKCGMALEPRIASRPEEQLNTPAPCIRRSCRHEPGLCPICGMALEPRTVTAEEANPELVDMIRRFWVSLALTVPLFLSPCRGCSSPSRFAPGLPRRAVRFVEFALATPVVLVGRLAVFRADVAVVCQSLA